MSTGKWATTTSSPPRLPVQRPQAGRVSLSASDVPHSIRRFVPRPSTADKLVTHVTPPPVCPRNAYFLNERREIILARLCSPMECICLASSRLSQTGHGVRSTSSRNQPRNSGPHQLPDVVGTQAYSGRTRTPHAISQRIQFEDISPVTSTQDSIRHLTTTSAHGRMHAPKVVGYRDIVLLNESFACSSQPVLRLGVIIQIFVIIKVIFHPTACRRNLPAMDKPLRESTTGSTLAHAYLASSTSRSIFFPRRIRAAASSVDALLYRSSPRRPLLASRSAVQSEC